MKLVNATKKHAISRGHLGCLGDMATINLMRGCAGGCVFCYARCLPGTPEPSSLRVYSELPGQLVHQLDRRKRPPPPVVLFSTASDPFLGGDEVVQLTRACLQTLVSREIGFSLSTRGDIPEDIVSLMARIGPHVRITVPLVSLSEDYTRQWEPGTLPPRKRLFLVQRLRAAGLAVQIRLDPIIPFVNDQTDSLRELVSAVAGLGQRHAMASFLHLRPGVERQIRNEAPLDVSPLVLGCFARPPDEMVIHERSRFQHLPARQRLSGLRRIQRVAREGGFKVSACHCQNPGIPARQCPVEPPERPNPRGTQLSMLDPT